MQLHELRRAGRRENNYYRQHLESFYVLRDSLGPFMGMEWGAWWDWYNDRLRTNPKEIASVLRQYAAKEIQ